MRKFLLSVGVLFSCVAVMAAGTEEEADASARFRAARAMALAKEHYLPQLRKLAGCESLGFWENFARTLGLTREMTEEERRRQMDRLLISQPKESVSALYKEVWHCSVGAQLNYALSLVLLDPVRARVMLELTAERGYLEGQFHYGLMLFREAKGPEDLDKAVQEWKNCAARGNRQCADALDKLRFRPGYREFRCLIEGWKTKESDPD